MKSTIPSIGLSYLSYISPLLKKLHPYVLLYGSSAYGKTSSDLDVCLIAKDYSDKDLNMLKRLTIAFQLENNMSLDAEVPYENKLIYRESEIQTLLSHPPFSKIDGIYQLTPVKKTKEYMHSDEMKYRLLLNVLTTHSIVIFGNEKEVLKYKNQAWDLLIQMVISYHQLNEFTLNDFLHYLYKDKNTGLEGELYLGYKTNIPQKQIDLRNDCLQALTRLEETKKISKISNTSFIPLAM